MVEMKSFGPLLRSVHKVILSTARMEICRFYFALLQCIWQPEKPGSGVRPQHWCLRGLTSLHGPNIWPDAWTHYVDFGKFRRCRIFHLVFNLSLCHLSQLQVICQCLRWQDCENIAFHKIKDQRIPLFQESTSSIDFGHIQMEKCKLNGTERPLIPPTSCSPWLTRHRDLSLRKLCNRSF